MVTVSGHARIQLSTMSRNRMKHALGTLEPSPHLGLWVWGATRGCAAYSCICVGPWAPIGTHRQVSPQTWGHTLTLRFAHTHA